MNIAYKDEKLCYYDVATGKYLDPDTLEEMIAKENEKVVETNCEKIEEISTQEPVVEKNSKKIK